MTATRPTIVVTGATGFAGSHLLARLSAGDHRLIGWHRPSTPVPARRGVEWQPVDLLDAHAVDRAVRAAPPASVIHLAGASHVGESWQASADHLAIHVRGTHHLLNALGQFAPAARTLVVSSGMVYRAQASPIDEGAPLGPVSPYALSKLAEEQLALHVAATDGLAVIVARPFNHIGPGQSPSFAASSFARQIARIEAGLAPPILSVGNLDAERDLTDVRDVVAAYQALVDRGTSGAVYNVCRGTVARMSDVLDRLTAMARVTVTRATDPARLRPNDLPTLCGNPGRLMRETGWSPTIPLDETLGDLLEDWRRRVASGRDPDAR